MRAGGVAQERRDGSEEREAGDMRDEREFGLRASFRKRELPNPLRIIPNPAAVCRGMV